MTPPISVLTVAQVAATLHVCRRTVYLLLKSGELKKTKVRSRTLIRQTDLERYLERHTA